jgi:hypothetical protein
MAKRTNRGRSSEPTARSPGRRERRGRGCAAAARPEHAVTVRTAAPGRLVPLTWNLTQATDWALTQTTNWSPTQATGRNLRQAKELTPS